MSIKSILKVASALFFLYAVFGYLFPEWGGTVFSNNENLAHLLTAIALILFAEFPPRWGLWLIALLGLKYIATGIYGFAHSAPADITIRHLHLAAHLDQFDNYANIVIGLVLAWIWLQRRRSL